MVLWLTYTVVFLAVQLLPSDPITALLATSGAAPEVMDQMRSYYGFDQPLHVQYGRQLGALFTGDFGYSVSSGAPVTERIGGVLGSTLRLAFSALAVAVAFSFAIVATARLTKLRRLSQAVENLPPLFSAIPVFWLGLVALYVLSIQLDLISLFPDGTLAGLAAPVAVLALALSAPISQVFLKTTNTVYEQPFVQVLLAKGLSKRRIFLGHVLKNSVGPVLTVLGLLIGQLLAGSVITETVFSRPGIGQILVQAVTVQDIALVQGMVLLTATVFVVVNLLVDLVYPLLDPRILKGMDRGTTVALAG